MGILKELLQLNEIDNGPKGRVKTDNIKYGQTRNATGYTSSKEELEQIRNAAKVQAKARRDAKKYWDETYNRSAKPSSNKIDLGLVARKIEEVVGATFPDSDPIDTLAPWLNKEYGIEGLTVGETLDKAVKKIGKYKDYWDYLATTWDDYAADFPGLEDRPNPWR